MIAAKEIASVSKKVLKNVDDDGIWFKSKENKFNFSSQKILAKSEYEFYQARKTPMDVLKLRIKEHDEALTNDPYSLLKLAEVKGFEEFETKRKEKTELLKKQMESLTKSLNSLYPNKHQLAVDGEIIMAVNSQFKSTIEEKKKAASQKRKESALKKKETEKSKVNDSLSSNVSSATSSASSSTLFCSVAECTFPNNNISLCEYRDDDNSCYFQFCELHKDHENHKFQTKTNDAKLERLQREKNFDIESNEEDENSSDSNVEEYTPINDARKDQDKNLKRKQSDSIALDIKAEFEIFSKNPKNSRKSHITSYCACVDCFPNITSTSQVIEKIYNCLTNSRHKHLQHSCWMKNKACYLCSNGNI